MEEGITINASPGRSEAKPQMAGYPFSFLWDGVLSNKHKIVPNHHLQKLSRLMITEAETQDQSGLMLPQGHWNICGYVAISPPYFGNKPSKYPIFGCVTLAAVQP